ncbi:hypothetical protein HDV01_006810 [Terramyces sp. JEL0728]|nr:hypothetical protein HDV01_006810 [Terramyces sp. JEL0728]
MTIFDPTQLKDYSKRDLLKVLDSVRGRKCLVIDQSVGGPLSLFTDFGLLKDHGVEKIYYLSEAPIDSDDHVKSNSKSKTKVEHSIYFVPRRTLLCDTFLEQEGVKGDLNIGEFHMDIIPLEDNVLSLEMEDSFKELYLDGDTSIIQMLTNALMKFQVLYGFFPRIVGKGDAAYLLAEMLDSSRLTYVTNAGPKESLGESDFDSLLILDRTVDMITPMRTQLTYEGLVDELYSIKSTFVELDASFFAAKGGASSINTKPKKVLLSGADTVFAQIRDQSFEMVSDVLDRITKHIQSEEDSRHGLKTPSELKEFAAKLGGLQAQRQSLGTHQKLYENVLQHAGQPPVQRQWDWEAELCSRNIDNTFFEFLEDLILANEPYTTPLKIACIYSVVNNGFKQKQFDQFRRDFCQAYGPKHLLTFQNLEKLGIFKVHSSSVKNTFSQVSKSLKLINDYTSKLGNTDISYVYAGYAPISIRLIQLAGNILNGPDSQNLGVTWKNSEDVLSLLPGKTFEKSIIPNAAKEFRAKKRNGPIYTLIVFIGGCTLAEISAIRKIGENDNRKFVVLTTSVVNGSRMLKSLVIE